MDACSTQTEPVASIRVESPRETGGIDWVWCAFTLTLAIGVLWRGVRYFSQFPIWGDEAMLLLNILDRDYAGLMQRLDYAQVAPLLFLWLEKAALVTFGSAEWSVHLFPMLAGLASLVIFWRLCRVALTPVAAGLSIAILAVSYYPIRHASEVKPYAFDLCYSVLLAWLTIEQLRQPLRKRWLIALMAVTPLAVFSSYPSVFVGGAVSLVLLPTMRTAPWSQRGLFVLFGFVLVASFFVHYGLIGRDETDSAEAQQSREFLRNYWKDAFPPEHPGQWPLWLLQVFTGNMLAYPLGANHGGSTLTFLLVLAGSISLWRSGQRSLLALCWFPFGLNLIAAMLGKYPFGDSARITLHLAPFICILMGQGIASGLEHIRLVPLRTALHLACFLLLIVCGAVGIVRDFQRPYKTEHDRVVRAFVRELASHVRRDEPIVLCHRREKDLLAELLWNLHAGFPSANLRWQADVPSCLDKSRSCWLVQFGHQEPSVAAVARTVGTDQGAWEIAETTTTFIPGENPKMLPVHCRCVFMVRRSGSMNEQR